MKMRFLYIVNVRHGGRVGQAQSMDSAKKLIQQHGELLTKYDVFRTSMKTRNELRIGTYQNKMTGYLIRGRGPLKVVKVA